MPQSDVFSAVAAESAGRDQYSPELHQRVDALVEEWLQAPERSKAPFGSSDGGVEGDVNNCSEFVKAAYEERFGDQHPGYGVPLIGFVLMSILGGIISWLVQRTLERRFPRGPGASDSFGESQ